MYVPYILNTWIVYSSDGMGHGKATKSYIYNNLDNNRNMFHCVSVSLQGNRVILFYSPTDDNFSV